MKQFFKQSALVKLAGVFFVGSVIAIAGLAGCGDDADSYDAKMYDAIAALDNEDWAGARAILETLPENEETLKYLSNTYAGDVGINTFNLLTTIDELEEGGNDAGSIDMIGTLIGDEYNQLACSELDDKLDFITTAVNLIDRIVTATGVELTDDEKVELGLASITRTVLIIAKLICLEAQEKSLDISSVEMTESWINDNKGDFMDISAAAWGGSPVSESFQDMLSADVENVGDAVDALADSNDIKDDFEEFRSELDNGNGGTADDGTITLGELNHYLNTL